MDLNLVDPSEIPVPPDDVRIRRLEITPVGDGRRLKVEIELTPFQQPPTLHLTVRDSAGEEVASTSIIEAMAPRMSFTLHLRHVDPGGVYRARYVRCNTSTARKPTKESRHWRLRDLAKGG